LIKAWLAEKGCSLGKRTLPSKELPETLSAFVLDVDQCAVRHLIVIDSLLQLTKPPCEVEILHKISHWNGAKKMS
jgi:hypothetical protein